MIPDNEKAGVREASRYEPDLNPNAPGVGCRPGSRTAGSGGDRPWKAGRRDSGVEEGGAGKRPMRALALLGPGASHQQSSARFSGFVLCTPSSTWQESGSSGRY